jgi:hypothetical protein
MAHARRQPGDPANRNDPIASLGLQGGKAGFDENKLAAIMEMPFHVMRVRWTKAACIRKDSRCHRYKGCV